MSILSMAEIDAKREMLGELIGMKRRGELLERHADPAVAQVIYEGELDAALRRRFACPQCPYCRGPMVEKFKFLVCVDCHATARKAP